MATTSRQTFFRTAILTVVAAFLIAMSAQPASANQSGVDVNAANSMRNLCGWMGGTGDMDVERYTDGIRSITVRCKGGGLDGLGCFYGPLGPLCWWSFGSQANGGGTNQPLVHDTAVEIEPIDTDLAEVPVIETAGVPVDQTGDPEPLAEPAAVEPTGEADGSATGDVPADDAGHEQDEASEPVVTADPATVDPTIDQAPADHAATGDATADPITDSTIVDAEIVSEPVDATMELQELEDDGD